MKILKFSIGIIILGLFTYFAVANSHDIVLDMSIKELPADSPRGLTLPAFILVYLLFCFGLATAWILSLGSKRSYKRKIKRLNKQVTEQELELTKLRNLPVTNPENQSESEFPQELSGTISS